jgi:hypothetical protein
VARVDPKGAVRWSRCINATERSFAAPFDLKVDRAGNTWMTVYADTVLDVGDGEVTGPGLGSVLLELDPSGKTIRKMSGEGSYPGQFALFDDGTLFVTGDLSRVNEPYLFGSRYLRCDEGHENFVTRIAPDGSTRWIRSEGLVVDIVGQTPDRVMIHGGVHGVPLTPAIEAFDGVFATIDGKGDVVSVVPVTDTSKYHSATIGFAGTLAGGDVIAFGQPMAAYRIGSTTVKVDFGAADLLIRLH